MFLKLKVWYSLPVFIGSGRRFYKETSKKLQICGFLAGALPVESGFIIRGSGKA